MLTEAFDAFSRTEAELQIKTKFGGFMSLVVLIVITTLFFTEISIYLGVDVKERLYVDSPDHDIEIFLDVVFPSLPCAYISVNSIEKTSNSQLNIHDNVFTTRLRDGKPITEKATEPESVSQEREKQKSVKKEEVEEGEKCGDCYGAQTADHPCCNTCEDVRNAYSRRGWAFHQSEKIIQCVEEGFWAKFTEQKGEGCNVHGTIRVHRLSGVVSIVVGQFILKKSGQVIVDTSEFQESDDKANKDGDYFNISHTIREFSFGKPYPGMTNPLNGVQKLWQGLEKRDSVMYDYYVKIVPTTYTYLDGSKLSTNQFSVTEAVVPLYEDDKNSGTPGFFVTYELSPINIAYTETPRSFLHFMINMMAIMGGIFTVAGLFDSFVYGGLKRMEKKVELGKLI